jgi:hypothetical protein
MLENGTLFSNVSLEMYDSYVIIDDHDVLVCTNYTQKYTITRHYFSKDSKFSTTQTTISVIGQIISIIGLFVHLIVYSLLPKLRNLAGMNLMSLSAALLVAQLLFLVGSSASSIYELCTTLAIVTHLAFLASFAWMHVMAFDIWKTFASSTKPSSVDSNTKKFIRYSLYGWGVPAMVILIAVAVNFGLPTEADARPAYGEVICWIRSRIGLAIFFAAPVAAILLCNIVFYSLTVTSIYRIAKLSRKVTHKSEKQRLWLYIKLTSIMGLTWVFGFVAAAFDNVVLWYFFIVINSLQGAFICIVFVCTRQVLKLLREKFSKVSYSAVSRQTPSTSNESRTRSTVISSSH